MVSFSAFIVSLLLSMALVPPVIWFAYRYNFVDQPNQRKVHKKPVPRVGGLAMFIAALAAFLLLHPFTPLLTGYWIGVIIIVVVGVLDDRFDLNYRIKFAAQISAIVLAIGIGDVRVETFPFVLTDVGVPAPLGYALALFFILTVTNAVNLSDGLDGLAGGVALLSLLVMVLMAFQSGSSPIAFLGLALAGSIFGFLMFNSHPARLFMGDTGSQFIGFSLGFMALHLTHHASEIYAPALPLLLVGLPLIDLLLVMARRVLKGRPLFAPDRNHLHHRLMNVGLNHYVAVFFIYAMQVIIVASAYLSRFSLDYRVVALFVAFLFMVHAVPWVLYRLPPGLFPMNWVDGINRYFAQAHLLGRWSTVALVVLIPLFLIAVPALVTEIESAYAVVAGIVLVNFFLWDLVMTSREVRGWVLRISLVAMVTLDLYLLQLAIAPVPILGRVTDIALLGLTALVIVAMHYAKGRDLSLRPLDILIVAVVVVLPQLARGDHSSLLLAKLAIYMVVLVYGIEVIMQLDMRRYERWYRIGLILLLPLSIVVVRGLTGW
ncbi:MAG: glycosyltransferase family 4 protein [Thiotrichales bacterium]